MSGDFVAVARLVQFVRMKNFSRIVQRHAQPHKLLVESKPKLLQFSDEQFSGFPDERDMAQQSVVCPKLLQKAIGFINLRKSSIGIIHQAYAYSASSKTANSCFCFTRDLTLRTERFRCSFQRISAPSSSSS